ncbi:MAG: triose-phosphate isomerase [Candidatus Muproteobacteria bacterium RIFCSPHIGHO2_12_FULL_60_33]|uniref:Triosephosphate isomerase n=1 Tax=Candidatus Muproteobacteria bacterium RIFCSPLOWO2_01_FULL_60_18 TaxID=1817768 RepID=A0A1F6TXI2_9PROT|nr:MAG: triose-phosphate isomerase [Candidatus Muproteobacteria bacterium RIFCSPHIGHO2_01_60_12]OGI49817.1 MAG: triose-phosphate isomerase [Candidatus Muproteobacteria bacterium RIFCSPLOWO2_01_FULL_60_18]OGI54752.1 MAG: triose-phosphate isomerase [Candidatus Muproteobacteria bacterium RIFCSPHIGHO2_12_FULL_60_33]OGI60214.1 MAG: triose-phosphate isomerase [Candidatus Muproteobacteria bacterium RIFCSPHIGHO2_01_FULL_61_200]
MTKRRPLVAGNWKMNGSRTESAALLDGIKKGMSSASKAEVAVCPPYILIPLAAEKLVGSAVAWGGQNLSAHESGAYTGEISGPMLRDYGCTYVIVGHSERRTLYGENDAMVAEKYGAAQAVGLIPILCVGETLQEREVNRTEAVVARQLDVVLGKHGIGSFRNAVVAYEPVWAIGTGKTATPRQAQDVHRFIRSRLAARDKTVAESTRILYGGSMKGGNAGELLTQPDIDGGLIGGASLQAEEFLTICRAAD